MEGVRATYSLDANGVVQGLRAPNTQDSNGADVPGALIPLGNALPILAISGSVAAPAYSFSASPSTGLFKRDISDGYFSVAVAGTNNAEFLDPITFPLAGGIRIHPSSSLSWAAGPDAGAVADTALKRNAAGVVEINNGTAGTFRDLIARKIGLNGNAPPAQKTGFGTPTGAGVLANFPGATATLAQCSQAIAEIITDLKALGLYGA